MKGKIVLVVDDSATIREIVADALKGVGFVVHQAGDGEDGLNKARVSSPTS